MFKKELKKVGGIYFSEFENFTSKTISEFYNEKPFPNYKANENMISFLDRGNKNIFIKKLKSHIGMGKKILEVGCGTGQVSNYLAAQTNNQVFGLDLGINSLNIGKEFADKNDIKNVFFINGDLFEDIFEEEKFDVIYCSGVLHHTDQPKEGFKNLVRLLKPNGIIIIGLYNWYGRIWTVLKSKLLSFSFFKKYAWIVDNKLKEFKYHPAKYHAWYQDQFQHPVESLHTFCETSEWFDQEKIKFTLSVPSITTDDEINFNEPQDKGKKFMRIVKQISMIFNHFGKEGGLYIFVGRK
tara:strand:+ start:1358 stop:2245 length:888 start_codon:yes stop_codon:yes gene_type:complete